MAAAALAKIKDVVTVTYNLPIGTTRETWRIEDWDALLASGPQGKDLVLQQLLLGAHCSPDQLWELHYTLDLPPSESSQWRWDSAKGLLADLVDERENVRPGMTPACPHCGLRVVTQCV